MSRLTAKSLAPAFSLLALDKRREALPKKSAPFSLLLFVKKECPTCQLLLPFFGRLVLAYKDKLSFSIVTQNEGKDALDVAALGALPRGLVFEEPAPYRASGDYQLYAVPSLFVLSAQGEVEEVIVGWSRAKYEALNQKLSEASGLAPIALVQAQESPPTMRPG